jgi:carbamoyltransferase
MIQWGINALNHGSSLAVFKDGTLISNEFDKSDYLKTSTLHAALEHGSPNEVYWYELPWLKKLRQLRAGQWHRAADLKVLPSRYLQDIGVGYAKVLYTPHHASHAAAGYYTSPFDECAVVVLDAIGEFECASIWKGSSGKLTKLWSKQYPNSLGLFYSAFTQLVGLTPVRDEFLFEQLAKQGSPTRYISTVREYANGVMQFPYNLHKGILNWPCEVNESNKCYIAAAVQMVFEEQIDVIMTLAKNITGTNSLVYMGGCAMNNTANVSQVETKFEYIWSLPQPGDPSSSIGSVVYHTKQRITNYNFSIVKHIRIRV